MKAFLMGGVAAAILAGVAPAIAQAPATQTLAAKVHTRAEVQARVQQHFARVDSNRDGAITEAEMQAMQGGRGERFAGRAGARSMHKADPAQRFAQLDTNKDGQISRAEFDLAHSVGAQRQATKPDGAMMRAQRGRGMGGVGGMGGNMFTMADANKDGRVTLQEAEASALRRFDMTDVNRDGQVTPDERRQMRMQMRDRTQG